MSMGLTRTLLRAGKTVSIVSGIVLLLTGCSGGGVSDLQAYVDQVKKSSKGRIEPLPEFAPVASFEYSASNIGDPFVSWDVKAALAAKERQKSAGGGLQPDMARRREPLEAFPLDTLRMVGTLEKNGKTSALVSSPDGLVSRIVVGNYLGQNYGKVIAIGQEKIDLVEIVPDGLGSWIQRSASLALTE
jgi:type IV pilus assembly protein PilP